MARSVAVPRNAVQVAYAAIGCGDAEDGEFDYFYSREEAQDLARAGSMFPSMRKSSACLDREVGAIAENSFAYIALSEYNGLVAVSLVAKDVPLAAAWCERVSLAKLERIAACFGDVLKRVGSFSNGEVMFRPADGVQKGAMGLGFTSKEGWL